MDLWIRSQNKRGLTKPYHIEIGTDNCIYALELGSNYEIMLGKYKTKKKALEVLDEIQNSMYDTYETTERDGNVLVRHIQPKQDNFIVYQMPADDEVK